MMGEHSNKTPSKIRYGPQTNATECPVQDWKYTERSYSALSRLVRPFRIHAQEGHGLT